MISNMFYLSFYNDNLSKNDFDGLVAAIKEGFKKYGVVEYTKCQWEDGQCEFQMRSWQGRDTWTILEGISSKYPKVELLYDVMNLMCSRFENGEGSDPEFVE